MMHPPSLSSRVHVPDGILFHTLEDELVLLNLNTGVYFGLNRVGTRIWRLLNEHPSSSLQQILSILVIEYAVTESRCAEELLSLVARLQEKRLLEVVH
jgi:hypothetical protein